jgi:hypothetical protein
MRFRIPFPEVRLINLHSSIPTGRRSITYNSPFNSTFFLLQCFRIFPTCTITMLTQCIPEIPLVCRTLCWTMAHCKHFSMADDFVLGTLIYFSFFHYFIFLTHEYNFLFNVQHSDNLPVVWKPRFYFAHLVFLSISYNLENRFWPLLLSLLLQNITYNQIIIIHVLFSSHCLTLPWKRWIRFIFKFNKPFMIR